MKKWTLAYIPVQAMKVVDRKHGHTTLAQDVIADAACELRNDPDNPKKLAVLTMNVLALAGRKQWPGEKLMDLVADQIAVENAFLDAGKR